MESILEVQYQVRTINKQHERRVFTFSTEREANEAFNNAKKSSNYVILSINKVVTTNTTIRQYCVK